MKNAFNFIIKALLVLKILKFLSWLFVHVEKQLDYEDKLNFKIYDVTIWLNRVIIHILSNISQNKNTQTMKFGQLIQEY